MSVSSLNPSVIDLNLMYTFWVFVRAGSLRAAARELGRTEPLISLRLKQLEEAWGVRLFERVGRRLKLTGAGEVLYEDVCGLVGDLRVLGDKIRAMAEQPHGALRVGALPTVATHLLAAPISQLIDRHPDLHLEVVHGLTPDLLTGLRQAELDVVFSVGRMPRADFSVRTIRKIEPVLVVPARSALAKVERATVQDIEQNNYIGYRRVDDTFFSEVERFLRRHGLDSQIKTRVGLIQVAKDLIAAGSGISILPDYTVTEKTLATVAVDGLRARYPIWYAVRKRASAAPGVQALLDLL